MDRSIDIITMGYSASDTILLVERYPAKGKKVRILESGWFPGGQAATAAVALRKWGMNVRFVGKIGDDTEGESMKEHMRQKGIDARGLIQMPSTSSQKATIVVDAESGERTIFWTRPKELDLTSQDLDPEWFESGKVLLLDGHEIQAGIRAAQYIKAWNGVIVLDAEELDSDGDELLAMCDMVFASSEFGHNYFNTEDPASVIQKLHGLGVPVAGVTLGAQGVLAGWNNTVTHFPAFPVNAKDTTGAGDIFHAAIAFGAFQNWPLERTIQCANYCAAQSCRCLGGQDGIPSLRDIYQALDKQTGEDHDLD
jgi:sulfofructose kinase